MKCKWILGEQTQPDLGNYGRVHGYDFVYSNTPTCCSLFARYNGLFDVRAVRYGLFWLFEYFWKYCGLCCEIVRSSVEPKYFNSYFTRLIGVYAQLYSFVFLIQTLKVFYVEPKKI